MSLPGVLDCAAPREAMSNKVKLPLRDVLALVSAGIKNGRLDVAVSVLDDLIAQTPEVLYTTESVHETIAEYRVALEWACNQLRMAEGWATLEDMRMLDKYERLLEGRP